MLGTEKNSFLFSRKREGKARPRIRESTATLHEIYADAFKIVRAETSQLKEAAYRIRYQVYCIEQSFEDPAKNPGGLERDMYDDASLHSLLIHRPSGMVAGTVRIVPPDISDASQAFPLQRIVDVPQLHDKIHMAKSCEISRFCISRDFRKRDQDGLYTGIFLTGQKDSLTEFDQRQHQRVIPFMPLGLIRACFEMGFSRNILCGYAILEPQLIRLLKKLGVEVEVVGEAVSHRGTRYPVEMDPVRIFSHLEQVNYPIWQVMTDNGRLVGLMEQVLAHHRRN